MGRVTCPLSAQLSWQVTRYPALADDPPQRVSHLRGVAAQSDKRHHDPLETAQPDRLSVARLVHHTFLSRSPCRGISPYVGNPAAGADERDPGADRVAAPTSTTVQPTAADPGRTG